MHTLRIECPNFKEFYGKCPYFCQQLTTASLESVVGREWQQKLFHHKNVTEPRIRGGYQFTVYIKNRYLRIDICIKSNMYVSKKISITNVNGQTFYISTENPLGSSEIAIILEFQPKCTIHYRFYVLIT